MQPQTFIERKYCKLLLQFVLLFFLISFYGKTFAAFHFAPQPYTVSYAKETIVPFIEASFAADDFSFSNAITETKLASFSTNQLQYFCLNAGLNPETTYLAYLADSNDSQYFVSGKTSRYYILFRNLRN